MGVTLYTSRVVLEALGIEDFGIYNVVGGVVALLGFINSSMSISVQRYLSYEIGKGNKRGVSRIISMSINIHFFVAIVVLILLEIFGLWFLENKINIPEERMEAALAVFHLSALTCCFSILQVPYMALMVTYERMNLYAYISIVEVGLKLAVAIMLIYFTSDSLVLYGFLQLLTSLIILLTYYCSCRIAFKDIHYLRFWDNQLFSSLIRFASWSALGEMAWGFTLQGVNIILNLFFGTMANAAYGISTQVSAAVYRFVGSFQMAINPQLIKNYAQGNVKGMLFLAFRGIRFSYFLLLLIAMPLILEMDFILKIWLGVVPDYASVFCRMVVFNVLLDILSGLFATLAKAYGRIRNYQLIVSFILFMNFPLSYFSLQAGYPIYSVFVVYSFISLLLIAVRIFLVNRMFHIRLLSSYLHDIIRPVFLVTLIALLFPLLIWFNMKDGCMRMFLLTLVSSLSVTLTVYCIGLTTTEKDLMKSKMLSIIRRFI